MVFVSWKWIFTPFARYLNIWILWCVCVWLVFHFVFMWCTHTINIRTIWTWAMKSGDMNDEMRLVQWRYKLVYQWYRLIQWRYIGLKWSTSFQSIKSIIINSIANFHNDQIIRYVGICWQKLICHSVIRIFLWQMQDCFWLIRTLVFIQYYWCSFTLLISKKENSVHRGPFKIIQSS